MHTLYLDSSCACWCKKDNILQYLVTLVKSLKISCQDLHNFYVKLWIIFSKKE